MTEEKKEKTWTELEAEHELRRRDEWEEQADCFRRDVKTREELNRINEMNIIRSIRTNALILGVQCVEKKVLYETRRNWSIEDWADEFVEYITRGQ